MNPFKEIIEGRLPADKVFENEHLIAFRDIHPLAPVHILIVPKKEIASLHDMKKEDLFLMGEIALAAQEIAKKEGIEENYRLVTNRGKKAGQTVFHLHFHLLGGGRLGSMV